MADLQNLSIPRRQPVRAAPNPAMPSPNMQQMRSGQSMQTGPARAAPNPVAAPIVPQIQRAPQVSAYQPASSAIAAYQETGDPFTAFAQGWTNSSAAREGIEQEAMAKMEAEASAKAERASAAALIREQFPENEMLARGVEIGAWSASDAMKRAETLTAERSATAESTAEKQAQINYLRENGRDDLAQMYEAGIISADDLGGAVMPPGDDMPASVDEYRFYASQEAEGGRTPLSYAEWTRSNSSGMSIRTNPDGTTEIIQGMGAGKPLTEGQSKDVVYTNRAAGALPIIDEFGSTLTDPIQRAQDMDPTGVIRGQQTPEYQQAQQAGQEFLQAILRKDTGAAITAEEERQYGQVYLPRPGDSPELLEQKRVSRQRALQALTLGLPPAGILALTEAGVDLSTDTTRRPVGDTPSVTNGPARPTSDEDYNALPSGAMFIDPDDGQTYTKP